MYNLTEMELPALVDLLSDQTLQYSQMTAGSGNQQEYEKCKQIIDEIQTEIAKRKQSLTEVN